MRGRYLALSILALATGVAGGIAAERYYFTAETGMGNEGPKVLYWVAPMDPNFRNDSPGKSPMGMDLIPVYDGQEASGDPAEVTLPAKRSMPLVFERLLLRFRISLTESRLLGL